MNRYFYLALCPWVWFAVADRTGGIGPAAAAFSSVAAAVAVALIERRAGRTAALAGFGAALFLADGVISVVATPWSSYLHRYDRATVIGVLALAMALSLVATPVTERYTSDMVTSRIRGGPGFRRYNTLLTRRCALAASAVAGSLAVGGSFQSPLAQTTFNWLVPIAVIVLATARSVPPLPSGRAEAATVSGVLSGLGGYSGSSHQAPFRPRLVKTGRESEPVGTGGRRASPLAESSRCS